MPEIEEYGFAGPFLRWNSSSHVHSSYERFHDAICLWWEAYIQCLALLLVNCVNEKKILLCFPFRKCVLVSIVPQRKSGDDGREAQSVG